MGDVPCHTRISKHVFGAHHTYCIHDGLFFLHFFLSQFAGVLTISFTLHSAYLFHGNNIYSLLVCSFLINLFWSGTFSFVCCQTQANAIRTPFHSLIDNVIIYWWILPDFNDIYAYWYTRAMPNVGRKQYCFDIHFFPRAQCRQSQTTINHMIYYRSYHQNTE